MQDLEALENKTCGDCLHFINHGERCDEIWGIVYRNSMPCEHFRRTYRACGNCSLFRNKGKFSHCYDGRMKQEYEEACENYEAV